MHLLSSGVDGESPSDSPQAIFSLLISTLNLARLRRGLSVTPLLINIIIDVLVAFFAIAYSASGLAGIDGDYCYGPYDPHRHGSCMRHALPARIFAGIALGAACVFGQVLLSDDAWISSS